MTTLASIVAVSFDVDGTLWDFNGAARSALSQVLAELARHDAVAAEMLDVSTFTAIRDRVHEELRGDITDLNEIRKESFKRALSDIGRADDHLAALLADTYFKQRDSARVLFDDVTLALERLAATYTLGLVSNGNSYAEAFGLEGLVSFGVYAQDHGGIEKPDPRIFRIAIQEAGCRPHELAHVGDSLENDVAGAQAVGAAGIWLNRNGHEAHAGITPDFEISTLTELVELL